jgi:uroporphyrinogen-III decarboxylase
LSGIEPTLLEDNAEFQLVRDNLGRRTKLCKASGTVPLPLDYPVKTMDDWLRIKPWYEFKEERVDREKLRKIRKSQDQGSLTIVGMLGGFDEPRQLLGEEELCVSYYEQPEMIDDMLATFTDTALRVLERVVEVFPVDCLFAHEDLAGKSGPLVGPKQIQRFIKPYYRRIWDFLRNNGTRIFSQDSDGMMDPVIDDFLDCGVNVFFPFEPGAGMDMVRSRRKYGKSFAIKGGIDKYALMGSKEEIRKELEYKLCDTMRGGGTIFCLDHRIPNGVPIENYRYYVKTGREILGLPVEQRGAFMWMAF